MAVLVAVFIVVILSYIFDHVRYWRRLDDFEFRALEFSDMYNYITPRVLNGDPEIPEAIGFEFDGTYYHVKVGKKDVKGLYFQLGIAIKDVQNAYERIGERYLDLMDDETFDTIEKLHQDIEDIAHIIRYQSWLNGVK